VVEEQAGLLPSPQVRAQLHAVLFDDQLLARRLAVEQLALLSVLLAAAQQQAVHAERGERCAQLFDDARLPGRRGGAVELEHRVRGVAIAHHAGQSIAFAVKQAVAIGRGRHDARAQREGGGDAPCQQRIVERFVERDEDAHGDRSVVGQPARDHATGLVEHGDHRARRRRERLERVAIQPGMAAAHAALERLAQANTDLGSARHGQPDASSDRPGRVPRGFQPPRRRRRQTTRTRS
jgi:hypothetical protein